MWIKNQNNNKKGDYDLTITFTPAQDNENQCANYDDNNDARPGVKVFSMDGITDDKEACIIGQSEDNDKDYYYFTVKSDGILKITTSSPNNEPFHLKIGTQTDHDKFYGDHTAIRHNVDQVMLHKDDTVAIYVKETGNELDKYRLDFKFSKSDSSGSGNGETTATCYAMSDDAKYFYEVEMQPGALPLPQPTGKQISQYFNGEGSAYRAADNKIYAFKAKSDDEGPSSLYKIDVVTGNIYEVKPDLLQDSVDGAEFYYDQNLHKEILYVTSGEEHTKLYALDTTDWSLLPGYPKSLFGDITGVSSIAIDPVSGAAYGVDDYNYDNDEPTLYTIDLKTGKTTKIVQFKEIVDAEGLAFASDGNLYIEDEDNLDGRKIYKVNISDGSLIPAAILGGHGDIEGLSCNGTLLAHKEEELIAEYRFDACGWYGINKDVKDSVGENNAKASNAYPSRDAVIERAAAFDDALIKADANYTFTNKPFALSFWMKAEKLPNAPYMAILGKEFELYLKSDGKLSLNPKNGSDDLLSSDTIKPGEWHYITISSDDKNVTLYIDGKNKGAIAAKDFGKNGETALMLGKTAWSEEGDNTDVENFKGLIDEVKIFDGSVDEEKIKKLITTDNSGKNYNGTGRQHVRCLTPIGCTAKAIVIDDTKYVHQIDLVTGEKNTTVMNSDQIGGVSVNGFGYNVKDGFLWGSYNPGKGGYLVKIGKDENGGFAQKKVGPIEGLPTNKGTYIGDVDHNGMLYLYYKNTPSKGTHTMYIVDLNRESADYLKVVEHYTLQNIAIADMAFNPIDKQLYAIENDNDLYKIDVTNKSLTLIKKDAVDAQKDTFGSSFFDSQGFFYAIKNSSRKIYRIDLSDPNNVRSLIFSTLVNENVQHVNIDGGRCNLKPIYIDYGDAPDSSSYSNGDGTDTLNYKTLTSDDGPRHRLPEDENQSNVYLGQGVGSESDAKSGIDNYNYDDDDGIAGSIKPLLTNMYQYSIDLIVHNDTNKTANLVGWIDFNRNGRFETKEGVKKEVTPNFAGIVTLNWSVSDDIEAGTTYMRFRVTTDALETKESFSYGPKSDGEVEDWQINIKEGSLYDVWDVDSNIEDRSIKTKKVNEDFNLTVASLNRYGQLKVSKGSEIKVRIVSREDGRVLQDYMDVNLTNKSNTSIKISDINSSSRETVIQLKYNDELNVTHEVNATDNFAIRPDKFKMDIPGKLIAGKDFNLTISALDVNGKVVANYNDVNNTVLDINETKNGCQFGKVVGGDKIEFKKGKATVTLTYDDVGKLKFTLHEKEGSEFAKIDQDDTNNTKRLITKIEKTSPEIKPAKMQLVWSLEPGDLNNDVTYYNSYDHNDPQRNTMFAKLKMTLSVKNEDNETVKNFSDACYAKEVPITIDYTITSEDHLKDYQMLTSYQDQNGTYHEDLIGFTQQITVGANKIQNYQLDKKLFEDGNATKIMAFNYKRNASVPREPMTFEINDINATLGDMSPDKINKKRESNDKKVTFLYVRAFIPDQTIVGDDLNATVYFEVYCKECDRTKYGLEDLTEDEDSIYWYKLPSIAENVFDFEDPAGVNHFGMPAGTISAKSRYFLEKVEKAAGKRVHVKVSKAPMTVRVNYKPKAWLVYNPFKPSAETHSFVASFLPKVKSWAGKGDVGFTVDTTINPRNNFDIIDW